MKDVTIYTSSGCEHCHEAKEFFEQNHIEYREHNISKDKEAKKLLMSKGYMSVPVIMIEDKEILGFDKEEISSLLGI
jgi:glutaredoxin 3